MWWEVSALSKKRATQDGLEGDLLCLESHSATCQLCDLGQSVNLSVLRMVTVAASSWGWCGDSMGSYR